MGKTYADIVRAEYDVKAQRERAVQELVEAARGLIQFLNPVAEEPCFCDSINMLDPHLATPPPCGPCRLERLRAALRPFEEVKP